MVKGRAKKPVAKAHVFGGETVSKALVRARDGSEHEVSNEAGEGKSVESQFFEEAGALAPPFPLSYLADTYEDSAHVRPNVDAYAANVDAGGHHYEPHLDLSGDDVHEKVRVALWEEARQAGGEAAAPGDEEVSARIAELRDEVVAEGYRLEAFFSACSAPEDFVTLRRRTRVDLEATGNAFWEVLRDGAGRVAQFNKLRVSQMRLLPEDDVPQEVLVQVRTTPITVSERVQFRRFRRYVQVAGTSVVFFKEAGDVRTMSAKSGKYYPSAEAMAAEEPGVRLATEVVHFAVYSPVSPYGVPRWMSAHFSVVGSLEADEVNYLYFENKSVPPLAVLVSGGRMTSQSVERIKEYVQEVKGKKNFHKILVIEAVSGDGDAMDAVNAGRMRVEVKPLTQAQLSDGQFLKYDERNAEKVGSTFRMPRLLRGDVRDFNRNTAEASLQLAEAQVFGPERAEFDSWVNGFVLTSLGIKHLRFESNAVRIRDPQVLAEIIRKLSQVGVLVPETARQLASDYVFGRNIPKQDGDWVWQPIMLTQVGVGRDAVEDGSIPPPGVGGGEGVEVPEKPAPVEKGVLGRGGGRLRLEAVARELLLLQAELKKVEAAEAAKSFAAAVKEDGGGEEVEVVKMEASEMVRRFGLRPTLDANVDTRRGRRGAS